MNKLKAVIVDDEKIARDVLSTYLKTYCDKQIELVAMCDGFNSAVEILRQKKVDLVFLDVEMPFGNGIDVLESIGNYEFKVVFTTAFDQYAIEALHNHAFDYLLKPISIKKLMKTVDDAFNLFQKQNVLSNVDEKKETIFLKIPSTSGFKLLKQTEILYAKALDNYCEIFTEYDQKFTVSKTLKRVETELNSSQFIRVHKSYVVNVNHIKSFDRQLGGQIIINGNYEIPISSSGKKLLNNYIN